MFVIILIPFCPFCSSKMASNTFCEPCTRKDNSSIALFWCNDCEEPLCKDCVNAHRVIKVSSEHQVVDLKQALSLQNTIKSQQVCDRHPNTTLDLFCTFHDVLCCRACAAESHGDCKEVIPIAVASQDIKESTLLSNLNEELGYIVTSSRTVADLREQHSNSLDEQEAKLKQTIVKAKSNIISYVESLEKRLLSKLQAKSIAKKAELEAEKDAMLNIENEAVRLQRQISSATSDGSQRQVFLLLHKVKSSIANMDQRIEKTIQTLEKPILQFKESNKAFTFTEELGDVCFRRDACSLVYNSPKLRFAQFPEMKGILSELEFENKFDINTNPQMQITGMTAASDGKLLLCNYRNNSILVFESNGAFLTSCSLFGAPWDICVVNDTCTMKNAIISMPQRSCVRFIDISTLKSGKVVELPGNCYGVNSTKDNILVGSIRELYILDTTGVHMRTVTVSKTTRMWYMNTFDDMILYSDQNAIYCVNMDGEEMFEYRSGNLIRPMAVAVDHRRNIYIAGCNSNNIHRINGEGKFIDIVLTETDKIDHPWAMCFDATTSRLIFANQDGKTICIFKCK